MYSDNMKVSVFPQRQENVGFAAVVARAEEQGAEDWDAAKG